MSAVTTQCYSFCLSYGLANTNEIDNPRYEMLCMLLTQKQVQLAPIWNELPTESRRDLALALGGVLCDFCVPLAKMQDGEHFIWKIRFARLMTRVMDRADTETVVQILEYNRFIAQTLTRTN